MDTLLLLLKILISAVAGLIAGPAVIYVFNRIPAKWLCDYGKEPEPGMWGERIPKTPWSIVFILVFMAASMKLLTLGYLYAVSGIAAIWLLLLIGIADWKYMIIPDQLVLALAVTALGFVSFHHSFRMQLMGAFIGGGSILLMGIIGSLIFRKEAMGFGDVKLFAAAGLLLGARGAVIVLLLTVFSSALTFAAGLISGRIKTGDVQPLGPFIAVSTAIYLLFLQELTALATLYLSL